MIFERIKKLVADQFAIEEDKISMDTDLIDDLDADSLDLVELSMAVEEEFGLGEMDEEDIKNIRTVGDMVDFVAEAAK